MKSGARSGGAGWFAATTGVVRLMDHGGLAKAVQHWYTTARMNGRPVRRARRLALAASGCLWPAA